MLFTVIHIIVDNLLLVIIAFYLHFYPNCKLPVESYPQLWLWILVSRSSYLLLPAGVENCLASRFSSITCFNHMVVIYGSRIRCFVENVQHCAGLYFTGVDSFLGITFL